MNNGKKFAEVFGIDLPIQIFCKKRLDERCKYCLEKTQCEAWITSEYEEKVGDNNGNNTRGSGNNTKEKIK